MADAPAPTVDKVVQSEQPPSAPSVAAPVSDAPLKAPEENLDIKPLEKAPVKDKELPPLPVTTNEPVKTDIRTTAGATAKDNPVVSGTILDEPKPSDIPKPSEPEPAPPALVEPVKDDAVKDANPFTNSNEEASLAPAPIFKEPISQESPAPIVKEPISQESPAPVVKEPISQESLQKNSIKEVPPLPPKPAESAAIPSQPSVATNGDTVGKDDVSMKDATTRAPVPAAVAPTAPIPSESATVPVTGEKRKAEEVESAPVTATNGALPTPQKEQLAATEEPTAKKAKVNNASVEKSDVTPAKTKAVTEKLQANGGAKKGSKTQKVKKVFQSVVGRTARKTRSQGPADA